MLFGKVHITCGCRLFLFRKPGSCGCETNFLQIGPGSDCSSFHNTTVPSPAIHCTMRLNIKVLKEEHMGREHFSADPYQDQEWVHTQKKKLVKDSVQTLILLFWLSGYAIILPGIAQIFSFRDFFSLCFLLFSIVLIIAGYIVVIMSIRSHIITALNLYKRSRDTPTPKE